MVIFFIHARLKFLALCYGWDIIISCGINLGKKGFYVQFVCQTFVKSAWNKNQYVVLFLINHNSFLIIRDTFGRELNKIKINVSWLGLMCLPTRYIGEIMNWTEIAGRGRRCIHLFIVRICYRLLLIKPLIVSGGTSFLQKAWKFQQYLYCTIFCGCNFVCQCTSRLKFVWKYILMVDEK